MRQLMSARGVVISFLFLLFPLDPTLHLVAAEVRLRFGERPIHKKSFLHFKLHEPNNASHWTVKMRAGITKIVL